VDSSRRWRTPFLAVSTTLAAADLDGGIDEQKARWLPSPADGSRIGTLARRGPGRSRRRASPCSASRRRRVVLTGKARRRRGAANLFVVAFRPPAPRTSRLRGGRRAGRPRGHPTMDQTGAPARSRSQTRAEERVARAPSADIGPRAGVGAWPAIARLFDRGAIATTGEIIGAAEGLRAHRAVREGPHQFGNPIGGTR
jgi:hypothetical protein